MFIIQNLQLHSKLLKPSGHNEHEKHSQCSQNAARLNQRKTSWAILQIWILRCQRLTKMLIKLFIMRIAESVKVNANLWA